MTKGLFNSHSCKPFIWVDFMTGIRRNCCNKPKGSADERTQSFPSVRSTFVDPTEAPGLARFLIVVLSLASVNAAFNLLQCAYSKGKFTEDSFMTCREDVKFNDL
jgi:hypothetical protein